MASPLDAASEGTAVAADHLVPTFWAQRSRGWPEYEDGAEATYRPLGVVLSSAHPTDVHFCAYSAPRLKRRLNTEAVTLDDKRALVAPVRMVAKVFDVDAPDHGEGGEAAVAAWFDSERPKIDALLAAHPGGFVYRTRGGYRIVYILLVPFELDSADARFEWKKRYGANVAYLRRRFGIEADEACADWTRLYRAPHATRDGGAGPEARETIGDPFNIGAWAPDLTDEDRAVGAALVNLDRPRRERRSDAPPPSDGEGILARLFRARGWLGEEDGLDKWRARCPNEDAHTGGARFDGSTVVYRPGNGGRYGWLHCMHKHCVRLALPDVLGYFSAIEREAAGETPARPATPPPSTPTPPLEAHPTDSSSPAVPCDKTYSLTDDGNALRFADVMGGDVRHARGLGWLSWDGARWRPNADKEVTERAKQVARRIIDEQGDATSDKRRDEIARWWSRSLSAHGIKNMLTLAESVVGIAAEPDDFDRDPWLFNCANGVVDLRTGELRPHRREDMLTKASPVAYDAAATCPRWLAWLEMVQPDADVRAFLQRRAGYALSGDTGAQTFDIDYGTGGNGKSMFNQVIAHIAGDYAEEVQISALVDRRDRAGNTPELAKLVSIRLAHVSEPADAVVLNMSTIKQVTGGDRLAVCKKHKDPFTFRPTFKLWMATNHEPQVPGGTAGEWRRVQMTGWGVRIPNPRNFDDVKAELLEEAPGILAWAVQGCLAYRAGGLRPPAAVLSTTDAFRRQEDPFAAFLADRCDLAPYRFETSAKIAAAYAAWASSEEKPDMSATAIGRELKKKGMKAGKGGGVRGYYGLSLKQVTEDGA